MTVSCIHKTGGSTVLIFGLYATSASRQLYNTSDKYASKLMHAQAKKEKATCLDMPFYMRPKNYSN